MNRTVKVEEINPVDYYNRFCVQDCIDKIADLKNVKKVGIDALAYAVNKGDEVIRMIVIKDGMFIGEEANKMGIAVGENLTPFMMLQKFVFKGNWPLAQSYVVHDMMNNPTEYIRVGVKYYKLIIKEDRYGIVRKELTVWDKFTIIDDHGKDYLLNIEKYNDFVMEPDNKNYQAIYKGNWNMYAPFDHIPVDEEFYKGEEQWKWINTLIHHIFGDQYELGIRYLKVLYDHPKQALPILVLISEERQTGKSTFLDFLNGLFGDNTVIINPQDISSSFNSTYANKNLVMIEESHFDSKQATEKLKNLSTQKKISVNTKFVKQTSLAFYGKLIITSNDEDKFSKVDDPEIRYWVRKVPTLKGKENHEILDDMMEEIPFFLAHLNTLDDVDLSKSRMVFTEEEIRTKELLKVKEESKVELQKELEMILDNHALKNGNVKTFFFTALDIKTKFFLNNNQISASYINKVIRSAMKLDKKGSTRYVPLEENGNILGDGKVIGRPYVFHNEYFGITFEESGEDKQDEEPPDVPF